MRRKVRKTIHELGGTMPENLPVAEGIKKVASREKTAEGPGLIFKGNPKNYLAEIQLPFKE